MKKTFHRKKNPLVLTLIFVFLALVIYSLSFIRHTPDDKLNFKVLLVYHPTFIQKYEYIQKAYSSVLEEEGIPFEWITPSHILSHTPEEILKSSPVIILPDGIAQILPAEIAIWLKEFILKGGNVSFIYDPGAMNRKIAFLDKSIFYQLLGFNYAMYNTLGEKSYTTGYVQFRDNKSAEFFQIPPGKLTKDLYLCGYQYGKLEYPVAKLEMVNVKERDVYANTIGEDGKYPCIILKNYGEGKILYVNLPLGALKAKASDDLLLREILRTFLFKVIKIPHLVNTYCGKGGIVFNWHLDDYREIKNTLFMIKNGYFRKGREYSIHITAGPFNDEPGDGRGFDAENKGKDTVKLLLPYGTIGSHGGWGHNWFAYNIEDGKFGIKEIEEYIKKNTKCLENAAGPDYKIVEYSAPSGIFPQPENTEILEKFGFNSYYYTGDSGSGPNRTFANGKMVSKNVIAFPVTALAEIASFQEMGKKKISPGEFQNWLLSILNYTVENRTVRFLYSHLYDLLDFPQYLLPFKMFLNQIDEYQKEDKLEMKPMNYFAKFLLRFLKTEYTFKLQENGLDVTLKNLEGLKGITLAIPKKQYKETQITDSLIKTEDEDYYYITCTEDVNEKTLHFAHR